MEGSYQSISHMMNNETTGIKFETIDAKGTSDHSAIYTEFNI